VVSFPPELPQVSFAATISPLHLIGCLAAALLAGFGALAAACLMGYSPTRLSQLLEEQRAEDDGRADEIDQRDRDYLVVATAYAAAGWILGLWSLLHATDAAARPWTLAVFSVLMLLLTGSLPVAIAQLRAERTLLRLLPFIRAGWYLLRWPLVVPLLGFTRLCLDVFRLRRAEKALPAEVQRQVIAAVADSVTEDALPVEERTWIGNIVGLKELQISTVMTPRPDIIAFSESMSVGEAVEQALEHGFSRYPVYRDRIDEVVGIFYVKDTLRLVQSTETTLAATNVKSMMREPLFVPESMGAAQLLRRFQAGNQHMAIVLDEYGTTAGLATIEDLIEEIVGDISDEYDSPHQETPEEEQITVVEEGRVLEIPARTTVAEINQLLGTDLSEQGDWETVAGMVIAKCNHIPVVGETAVIDGVEFRVLAADERRLQRLRATALASAPAEDR
jgi:CBS domain containing-hemolysin-like protein